MKPQLTIDGLTFFPIPTFDKLTQAFGAPESAYFNRYKLPEIPRKYADLARTLFHKGGTLPEFQPEVEHAKAMAATRAWLSSFAPAHESKMATVAYAFWVWSEGELALEETQ